MRPMQDIRPMHAPCAHLGHGVPGRRLVAHHADLRGLGPDELQPVVGADLDKVGVLREEAVAGVDRLRAAARRGGEEVGDVEVRRGGGRVADAHGLVGELRGGGG
jgi:hypothetical protein